MYFDMICSIDTAKKENLIPVTVWLYKDNLDWLIKERKRIGDNDTRQAMIVQQNSSYALFVNDVTGRYFSKETYYDMCK